MSTEWYRKSTAGVLKEFGVDDKQGLSESEVKSRRSKFGSNQLESATKINPFLLFLSQFNDVLVIILIIAAGMSLGLAFLEEHGSFTEPILIIIIVLAIAVIGFLNEFKAEKTVEALKKLVAQNAKVRRHGKEMEVPASELVPGDIVLLEEGQKVPADLRLLSAHRLQINEASLTGESVPVSKKIDVIKNKSALGDQKNMVFSGTFVTVGTGEAVVVGTGQSTEIGKIATLVNEVEDEQTPMQRKLDDLGKKLGALILLISIVVFVVIFFVDPEITNEPLAQRLIFAFTVAVALAVAAIPEGLSFVVRISLALGARRMASRNALVRKLSAVEALGSTDVISSDKTGTLTKGEMTVREIWVDGKLYQVSGSGYSVEGEITYDKKPVKLNKGLERILSIGALNNNAKIQNGTVLGDPTEGALIVSALKDKLKTSALTHKNPRIDEIPFSSERKMMTTVHDSGSQKLVTTKGAVDVILHKCDRILKNGKVAKLTAKDKKKVLEANENMAKNALRVLGFAYKEVNTFPKSEKTIEEKLIFVGLQGMMDPPRKEVKATIKRVSQEAGIRVLMVTGDYIETAKAVAIEIGIEGEAISGPELDELSQAEFEDKVEEISVYARVNPEHKIRIVKALKKHGHQVAMTGDGVNDAPAIKAADIGIAMGITGTDAAKEASDLILLDDKFLTIVKAVEDGRGIFDNIRKFVSYLLGANIAEVLVVLGGIIIFKNPILTATQLLFINIVTDGLPAVALGSDPPEEGVMNYKPFHFQQAIINRRVWVDMFVYAVVVAGFVLAQFWFARDRYSLTVAISSAFTALVIYELVRLVVLRTNYKIPWFSNPWLSVALASSVIAQLAVIYFEPLATLFKIESINNVDWLIIGAGSGFTFLIMKEVRRLIYTYVPDTAK